MSRAPQKRVRCPGVGSLPLSECREMTLPGDLRRQDSSAATTTTSAFVRTAPASVHPVLRSVTVSVHQGVSRHLPSASPPPGAAPPRPGSSGGEAAVSRPPDGDQCLLYRRAVHGRLVPAQTFRGASDQHLLFQERALSCLLQDTGRMSPAVSRPLTEIVQHLQLPCLPCLQICLCLDHRELHSRCFSLIQRTSTLLSSFTSPFS
jgi:hypothetical protein